MEHPTIYLGDIQQRPRVLAAWERTKSQREVYWLAELVAEFLGVFFYVYAGVGSQAGFVIGNILKQPFGSILQIGLAYGLGIMIAICVCTATSGGHFNPAVTLSYIVYKGFPPIKGLRYILAQIFGAYMACLFVYIQWKEYITLSEGALAAAGQLDATLFTPNGPAGIFALYLPPGQTFTRVWVNEFITCIFLSLIIWASLDPTNLFIPPSFGPPFVGLGYAIAIWGFGVPGVALNASRDLGARLLVMTVWGHRAFGGKYAAIAMLTNLPATLIGITIYELFLTDSDRVVPRPQLDFGHVMMNHRRLKAAAAATAENGGSRRESTRRPSRFDDMVDLQSSIEAQIQNVKGDKGTITTFEHAPR